MLMPVAIAQLRALAGVFCLALLAFGGRAAGSDESQTRYPVIAAAGDIACDPFDPSYDRGRGTSGACRQRATSNLPLEGRYAAVLDLGDNQYENGAYSKYLVSYARSWGRVKRITHPAPGNHEYETPNADGYFRYFGRVAGPPGRGYYSFDIGSWHLVSLNSNCSEIGGCEKGSPEERWLRRDLAAHTARCTLAYWHHPRFSSGPHGDDPDVSALWQALYDGGADVVLSGHDHDYERFAPQNSAGALDWTRGIREFVVGTGGRSHYAIVSPKPHSEMRDSSSFGILALTLRPAGYGWRFLPAVGSFTDDGSAQCH
jgi:Calcineurin-like phosphoesterase